MGNSIYGIAVSGMHAAQAGLLTTSHNIANVNTTGFKESRAEFAEVFSSTGYGLLRNGIGAGVRLTNVAQQFSQGDINQTGRYLDMAVDKEGFFEKRCAKHRPEWVGTAAGPGDRGGAIHYCRIDEDAALVWAANMAALEIHVPMAAVTL